MEVSLHSAAAAGRLAASSAPDMSAAPRGAVKVRDFAISRVSHKVELQRAGRSAFRLRSKQQAPCHAQIRPRRACRTLTGRGMPAHGAWNGAFLDPRETGRIIRAN